MLVVIHSRCFASNIGWDSIGSEKFRQLFTLILVTNFSWVIIGSFQKTEMRRNCSAILIHLSHATLELILELSVNLQVLQLLYVRKSLRTNHASTIKHLRTYLIMSNITLNIVCVIRLRILTVMLDYSLSSLVLEENMPKQHLRYSAAVPSSQRTLTGTCESMTSQYAMVHETKGFSSALQTPHF